MRVWKTEGWCMGFWFFFPPELTCSVSTPHHDRWLIQCLPPLHQLSSSRFLHPPPPSFPSPSRADGKTCLRHLHHPSLQAILCTQMSHRLEDSHFYSWEWLISGSWEGSNEVWWRSEKGMTPSLTHSFPSQLWFHGFITRCTSSGTDSRIHLSTLQTYTQEPGPPRLRIYARNRLF